MADQKPKKKVNYLNNRDILKEIHKSKNTYCSYRDRETDHQFDIILPAVEKINLRTVAQARRNRAARLTKETGIKHDEKKIPNTELVFRVTTWDHIPMVPKKKAKNSRSPAPKKRKLEDIMDFDDEFDNDVDVEEIDPANDPDVEMVRMKMNFPPFFHYRIDENRQPYLVGKSHWKGDLETGYFSKDHGTMTHKLATMFLKLCERYATRFNWRGYSYNEEMRGQALLQLSQVGLQFDESKSQNPFAYYTATITNSFTRVLNTEKKNQSIRDDILEMNGLDPSWTRQFSNTSEAQLLDGTAAYRSTTGKKS